LTVPAKDTVVLRVATPFGLALDQLFPVPDRLRTAANYRDALRKAKAAPTCPDYEALAERVRAVQAAITARDVRSPEVLAQLRPVAAALTISSVRAAVTTETAWWNKRLAYCTDAARREILAAIGVLSQ
jgi:hypothetical protein